MIAVPRNYLLDASKMAFVILLFGHRELVWSFRFCFFFLFFAVKLIQTTDEDKLEEGRMKSSSPALLCAKS